VTVCTDLSSWYTHTHILFHLFSQDTYTLLVVTKFTHNQWHFVQISDTEFHPYWKNLKYRQKFIYVLQYTCHCTNFHKTHNNAIQFMDISCTIFYPNQEKPQTTGATFLLYE